MLSKFINWSAIVLLSFSFAINAQIVINEVDADQVGTDSQEFVELFGPPSTALDGMVLVFYNGSGDTSYRAVDLDGQALDANGFFVYGSASVPNVDLSAGAVTNLIQNGRDAVALYTGNDTDFPNGTAVTATNIIDALVYDTNDSDDLGLLAVLTPGQAQINEGGMGSKDTHSNSRVPDGGAALNTTTYTQQLPTPGTTNSPVAVSFSIDDVAIVEGDAGTTTLDFTVTISATADATVDWATSDGTATTADSDYVAVAATTLTFTNGGALTQTVSVTINGDTAIETDETFNVDLSNAVGATIADNQGVGTITNDDSASFSINDVNIVEGNAGTSLLNFTVSKAGNAAASVDWATSDGTATTADNDYIAVATTTLNFTAAQTTQNVSVTINGDTVIETDETFNIDLSNPTGGATIADNQGVGTITNDDSVQAILSAIKSVSGAMLPGGTITYTIDITNTGPNPQNDNPGDEMTDVLPALVTFVSASATSGVVSNVGNTVSWNGSVAAGGTETITIVAQVNSGAAGVIENTAVVSFDSDGDDVNDATANSQAPGAGAGPTAFFIAFMVPSLSTYALLILMISLLSVVFINIKKRN